MIKNIDHHSINSRNYAAAYYQTLVEVPRPLRQKKSKNTKHFQIFFKKWGSKPEQWLCQKLEKNGKNSKKNAKIRDVKILQDILLHL